MQQEADRKMNFDLDQPYSPGLTNFGKTIRNHGFPVFREAARFLLLVTRSQVLSCNCQLLPVLKSGRPGANRFVQAPVQLDQFTETLRDTNLYWLPVNQPAPPTWSI